MRLSLIKLKSVVDSGGYFLDYYFHSVDLPVAIIEYERFGPQLYRDIDDEIRKKVRWYHKYHQCETCNKCHQCETCHKCKIECNQHGQCLSCDYPIVSKWEHFNYRMSKELINSWRTKMKLYVYNQELIAFGARKYVNVLSQETLQATENLCKEIQDANANKLLKKQTVHKSNGKNKYFFGLRYLFVNKQFKCHPRWKISGGIKVDVDEISPKLKYGLIAELERKKILSWNSINAAAFNDYLPKIEGIGKHIDESTKFVLDEKITSIRMFNDAQIRWGGCRFKKNALCAIPLLRGNVFVLIPWKFAKDWGKHSIANTDLLEHSSSWILRRAYPFVIQMCRQTNNNV